MHNLNIDQKIEEEFKENDFNVFNNQIQIELKKSQNKSNSVKDYKNEGKNLKKSIYQEGLYNSLYHNSLNQDNNDNKSSKKPILSNKVSTVLQKQDQKLGIVGIKNLGNTCYQNSVIQCLSNIQPLRDYCFKKLHKSEINYQNKFGSNGLIATAFSQLILDIWNCSSKFVDPSYFHKIIAYVRPMFGEHTQEDAQEFFLFLLDYLHEDLNRVNIKQFIPDKEYTENLNEKQQEKLAADNWKNYLLQNKSVIIDLFQGQLKNSITCQVCNFKKYKFEPFMYLSLPLEDHKQNKRVHVIDCLQQFLSDEQLEDSEQWECSNCNKKQKASKKIDLWKLPNILMIMFKRFKFDMKGGAKKINQCLSFDTDFFDLKNFIPKELQKEDPHYELTSVLCHKGEIDKGHYYTYAKNLQNGNWYCFNDEKTIQIQDPERRIPASQVYMLIYQKCTNKLIRQQSVTDPSNWPHHLY